MQVTDVLIKTNKAITFVTIVLINWVVIYKAVTYRRFASVLFLILMWGCGGFTTHGSYHHIRRCNTAISQHGMCGGRWWCTSFPLTMFSITSSLSMAVSISVSMLPFSRFAWCSRWPRTGRLFIADTTKCWLRYSCNMRTRTNWAIWLRWMGMATRWASGAPCWRYSHSTCWWTLTYSHIRRTGDPLAARPYLVIQTSSSQRRALWEAVSSANCHMRKFVWGRLGLSGRLGSLLTSWGDGAGCGCDWGWGCCCYNLSRCTAGVAIHMLGWQPETHKKTFSIAVLKYKCEICQGQYHSKHVQILVMC